MFTGDSRAITAAISSFGGEAGAYERLRRFLKGCSV